MSNVTEKFIAELQQALARLYHRAHSEATMRGIQAAKARKKLLTGSALPCKQL